jgi:flagellar basal-body rod protein FlgG
VIRALYTAATGMNAQQANIDNIAHNLANVNTAGFKKSRVEFEDLVYQQVKAAGSPTTSASEAPTGLDIGLGTRPIATARDFTSGSLRATGAPLDLAVEGRGFFSVSLADGRTAYTRAGTLHLAADGSLVTSEGYAINPPVRVPANAVTVTVSREGRISATAPGQSTPIEIGALELTTFQNPAGLTALGGTLFEESTASGEATVSVPGVDGAGTIVQGFLEDSNVSVVEEMVNMILGQRAYEANSKVVKAADEMLGQINNLTR